MAIGLNGVKEICLRCPLAMNESLLQDLAQYKSYRDRSVMMAARSLIQLFRTTRPELLHKKDRGRPTEATKEIESLNYGKVSAKDYIPGAEVLLKGNRKEIVIGSESSSEDGEWINVEHSVDETEFSENEDEIRDGNKNNSDTAASEQIDQNERRILKAKRKSEIVKKNREMAKKVTLERILTDDDFKQIDTENVRKQVQSSKKGLKRKIEDTQTVEPPELVKLTDIENIYKKRKHDKQTRIESVRKGQADREKFGYRDGRMNEHCSRTNREKRKNKNFQMMRHKAKGKVKKSFKDKQIALRNHLLKLKKMK